jgi:predicted Zn-dependent protease
MAIKGHALCHLGSDVEASHQLLLEATQSNPNDPMAWLYSCVWSTMWGKPGDSIREADNALALSPLDPQKYYFEMMLANCCLANGETKKAIDLCESSLKKNRYHLPTIRTLVIAQYESGVLGDARRTLGVLRSLQPNLTVSRYLASGSSSPLRIRGAEVFAALGLPH